MNKEPQNLLREGATVYNYSLLPYLVKVNGSTIDLALKQAFTI